MNKGFLVVVLAVLSAACLSITKVQAQEDPITAAVARGNKTTPDGVGLILAPSGFGLKDFVGGGISLNPLNSNANPWDGFAVVLHTAPTWVEQAAAKAKLRYQPFAVADVTDEMRRPVLRIFANQPYVDRIVVRSADKMTIIQPTASVDCPADGMYFGGYEGSLECKGFEFTLEDVRKIQSTNKNGEFLVTVVLVQGAGERDFKVQRKHLKKLPTL